MSPLLRALGMGVAFSSTLAACSLVVAFRECGARGCPGDAAITAAVQKQFQQHASIEPPNLISVQTIDQVVYLYGLLETEEQRDLATEVAGRVPGVKRVVNAISIDNEGR